MSHVALHLPSASPPGTDPQVDEGLRRSFELGTAGRVVGAHKAQGILNKRKG